MLLLTPITLVSIFPHKPHRFQSQRECHHPPLSFTPLLHVDLPVLLINLNWSIKNGAATGNYFHHWFICRRFSKLIFCPENFFKIVKKAQADFFNWFLFFWLTVQNPNDVQFAIIEDEDNQQRFKFEKLSHQKFLTNYYLSNIFCISILSAEKLIIRLILSTLVLHLFIYSWHFGTVK